VLSIQTFGSLQVQLEGAPLSLPASRKTRALLAYLILSDVPQRRDRLCELLWEAPDDPRGSLRWSLSKLRPILNAGCCVRLLADRERVRIDSDSLTVDFHELRACANDDEASPSSLARLWESTIPLLLGDCDLPDNLDFSAWLTQQRSEIERLRIRLSRRLALCPHLDAEDADKWAQRWLAEAPTNRQAAERAVAAKRNLGRESDALALALELNNSFRSSGLAPPDFASPSSSIDGKLGSSEEEAEVLRRPRQTIRFVRASDATCLAWASVGSSSNPPLVKAANWLSHLELDWEAPIWSPLFRELARTFHFIRYDERGCGLSNWEVPEINFEAFVTDLETVVDAAGLERFALLGISQGASVSIEYAARHPDRVTHLVLFGGYTAGWRHTASAEEAREREAVMTLTRAGWGRANPSYRNIFSQTFMPDAQPEELRWFDEFQRRTTSPLNAVRFLEAFSQIDVRSRLSAIQVPTLVIHSRGDQRIPLAVGRDIATRIPNAEFVGVGSNNHLLLGRESGAVEFLQATREFLTRNRGG